MSEPTYNQKKYSNYSIFTRGFAFNCVSVKPKKNQTTHYKLNTLTI